MYDIEFSLLIVNQKKHAKCNPCDDLQCETRTTLSWKAKTLAGYWPSFTSRVPSRQQKKKKKKNAFI